MTKASFFAQKQTVVASIDNGYLLAAWFCPYLLCNGVRISSRSRGIRSGTESIPIA